MAGFAIEAGARVKVGTKVGQILHRIGSAEVLVEFANGEKKIVAIARIKSPTESDPEFRPSIDALNEKQRAYAIKLMDALMPLARYRRIPGHVMAEKEKEVGLDSTNIRRKLRKWRETNDLIAFAPPMRPGGRGKPRLDPAVDLIVESTIKSEYLAPQKISIKELSKIILAACKSAGLRAPNIKTIARRIHAIPNRLKVKKRHGYSEAHEQFELNKGTFPDATRILEVVQIDHTESDVILVDEVNYLPIGRATITAAVDVYTGMCVGLLIGLNKPSADVVGMCIYRCMMPKDEWLKSIGVKANWPIWGLPYILHSDNGSDFRSYSLTETLKELDIRQVFRPVGAPRFGGHIEGFMKLISNELHTLPGTTQSNISKRGNYDSEGKAVLTIRALEKILVSKICVEYHNQRLNGGLTPLQHFELAVKNENYFSDRFQRAYTTRQEKDDLRISLLPLKLVTVQKYGIQLDRLRYSDAILGKWVAEANPNREDGKYLVRRDPTDYSTIYFLHPERKRYFPIGFANPSNPRFGEYEYRAAVSELNKEQAGEISEEAIVAHIRLKREIVAVETKRAKEAKRDRRRAEASRIAPQDLRLGKGASDSPANGSNVTTPISPPDDDDIKPFDTEDH